MDINGTFHRVDDPERFGETFGLRWVRKFYETVE